MALPHWSGAGALTRPHLLLGLREVDLGELQHQHVVPLVLDGHFVAKGLLVVPLGLIQDLVLGVGAEDWQLHAVVRGWGQKKREKSHQRQNMKEEQRPPNGQRHFQGTANNRPVKGPTTPLLLAPSSPDAKARKPLLSQRVKMKETEA